MLAGVRGSRTLRRRRRQPASGFEVREAHRDPSTPACRTHTVVVDSNISVFIAQHGLVTGRVSFRSPLRSSRAFSCHPEPSHVIPSEAEGSEPFYPIATLVITNPCVVLPPPSCWRRSVAVLPHCNTRNHQPMCGPTPPVRGLLMCYLERPDRKWRRIQPYRSSSLFFARWSTIAQPAPTMSAAIINFTKSPGRNGYIPLANNSPPAARRRGRWPQRREATAEQYQ